MENTAANDNYDLFEDGFYVGGSFEERRSAKIEKCDCTLNLGLRDMAGLPIDPELEKVICELESSWNMEG